MLDVERSATIPRVLRVTLSSSFFFFLLPHYPAAAFSAPHGKKSRAEITKKGAKKKKRKIDSALLGGLFALATEFAGAPRGTGH